MITVMLLLSNDTWNGLEGRLRSLMKAPSDQHQPMEMQHTEQFRNAGQRLFPGEKKKKFCVF